MNTKLTSSLIGLTGLVGMGNGFSQTEAVTDLTADQTRHITSSQESADINIEELKGRAEQIWSEASEIEKVFIQAVAEKNNYEPIKFIAL